MVSFPKIAIPDAVKQKFEQMLKTQGILAALQLLTPIELHVKILSNVTLHGKVEDAVFLYKVMAGEMVGLHPKDLEAFLFQLLVERGSEATVKVELVKHDGETFYGVFISRPKE